MDSSKKNLQCKYCEKVFQHRASLLRHLKNIHKELSNKNWTIKCSAAACEETFQFRSNLRDHIQNSHNKDLEREEMKFLSFQEFEVWKKQVEMEMKCCYILKQTPKCLASGASKYYYSCFRSGSYLSESTGKKELKNFVSRKIGGCCPSSIDVTRVENQVTVTFWKTHFGHDDEIDHFINQKGINYKGKDQQKKWKQEKEAKKQQKLLKTQDLNSTNVSDKAINLQNYTVSIAVPGAILNNAQTPELKAYLAGQIARAAGIFNVNEIIVYSESGTEDLEDEGTKMKLKKGSTQLIRILQYLECPQYLRRYYFPIHKDLEYAGLVNPLNLPHHLRVEDESKYREGVVLDKPVKEGKGSYVYIGLKKTAVIDRILQANVRVTVKLDEEQNSKKHFKGTAVSPTMPLKKDGIYWGYSVRLAKGLNAVFKECPYKEGYDLTIGTSDKGQLIDDVELPKFSHILIVFGGLKGIEAALEGDEMVKIDDPSQLFNYYLNTCPSQGCRSIRTEEAILITLSAIRPVIAKALNT